MNHETRKLMQINNVNYQRANRLLKEFENYDAVMSASYDQLIDVKYIGEVTARSIFNEGRSEPVSLV